MRLSHGRILFDSCNVQKRATKSDTSGDSGHCLELKSVTDCKVFAVPFTKIGRLISLFTQNSTHSDTVDIRACPQ